jgi:hypothetical protein
MFYSAINSPTVFGPNENSIIDVLQGTPLDKLDETIEALKKRRPAAEVRAAMIELLATAPLSDFAAIKQVFMKHFGGADK